MFMCAFVCVLICAQVFICVFSCLYNPILLIPGLILFTVGFSTANRNVVFVVCTVDILVIYGNNMETNSHY